MAPRWNIAVVLLLLWAGAGRVQAAPLDDLSQMLDRYRAAMGAENYPLAESLAKQMLAVGEANLQNRPDLRSTFHGLLATCYQRQERYIEALPHREQELILAEKAYGANHVKVAEILHALGNCEWNQDKIDLAAARYARALRIREQQLGRGHADTRTSREELASAYQRLARYAEEEPLLRANLQLLTAEADAVERGRLQHDLANCLWNQGKKTESVPHYEQAAALRARALGENDETALFSRNELAEAYLAAGRLDDAERVRQEVVAIKERAFGAESVEVADELYNLGLFYQNHARFAQAEAALKRALALREKTLGADHVDVAYDLHNLSYLYYLQSRYAESEALDRRALALREKHLPADDLDLAYSLSSLADSTRILGRLAETEELLRRSLAIRQKLLGEEHEDVATTLYQLGLVYQDQGRLAEAEGLYRRAAALRESLLGAESEDVAVCLTDLATVVKDQGRFAEAEQLHRRALRIREAVFDADSQEIANSLYALSAIYFDQHRFDESETLAQRALKIWEKTLGAEHDNIGTVLDLLAKIRLNDERLEEAEALERRSLKIFEKIFGPEHPSIAYSCHCLGAIVNERGQTEEAQKLHERGLRIREKTFGPDHPNVADSLQCFAIHWVKAKQFDQAEILLDRAIMILERTRATPSVLSDCYFERGKASWALDRQGEALADLRRAIDVAEQVRGQVSGAEHERAQAFGRFTPLFETMAAWQTQLNNPEEVFAALEMGRARSLLDEMNLQGADVHIGRSAAEREQLASREAEIKHQIAEAEQQLSAAETDAERKAQRVSLSRLREQLYEHYRNERSSSPVYRNLLSVGAGPPRLSQVQRRLAADDAAMWMYLFGEEAGYLLTVRADAARVYELKLSEAAAKTLGVAAGPLTQEVLQSLMVREDRTGVVQQLAASASSAPPVAKLHALWQSLAPEAERETLLADPPRGLVIVPDGALALLPLETLVVQPGNRPTYLLDVGPPLVYAPSATVLYNLTQRPAAPPAQRKPVLSVGDPRYHSAGKPAEAASGTRYAGLTGRLAALPHTALEVGWVAEMFGKQGIAVGKLLKADATEANVRHNVSGRRIVHLACHGMTDQSFGNFFGALALSPGPDAETDPADDGFLTLAEIYALNLRGCELAILSACETNYGPRQKGEGIWALSRGFLVAGTRRVVASNWLVDDEAAASLVSVYCDALARGEKAKQPADYAAALQTAKRWIRKQDQWKSPYYWGTFVLVGPN